MGNALRLLPAVFQQGPIKALEVVCELLQHHICLLNLDGIGRVTFLERLEVGVDALDHGARFQKVLSL